MTEPTLQLSRRRFLQLAGISLIGSAAGLTQAESRYYGRSFAATPVYAQPDPQAHIVTTLWPDTVMPIWESTAAWYQTDTGFVLREHMQPLGESESVIEASVSTQPPFWAEVIAPVAPIYAHCALDAPLVDRIGYGGVMRISDWLPGPPDWYAVSTAAGQLVGWSQALRWRSVALNPRPIKGLALSLDQGQQQLQVYNNAQPLLTAAYASPQALSSGEYMLRRAMPGDVWDTGSGHYGAAWNFQLEDAGQLSGVYWHNRFGESVPGPMVQLPPVMARWLYAHLPESATLRVHS